eukprot:CAMPEP_0202444458 /NCGR_PEP_ID=MMETSP1360-20130828/3536_1 /ASSEMBLY_ACC=CAM_ASM_000848 /TAXON_ID=515479 /ORGANISM="Licmophora paradoxa, Strain CCMP2313" /LENGTH=251 /DNA_ID=CAMNT_0049060469 /DNA_START=192 /DNA_END=947 /DNA_ORIENTATION=-
MVRIVNEKGNDLVVKLEDDMCNMANICDIMIKSLQRKEIPPLMYLKLLKKEKQALNPRGKSHAEDPQEIVLATKSIVRAELDFADAEGVVATQVGKIGSTEVIKVTYDSVATAQSFEGIIRHALFHHDLQRIFCINEVQEEAAQKEILKFEVTHIKISLLRPAEIIKPIRITKIFLQRDSWRFMPLTPFQATLVNLTLWKGRPDVAASLLSPRQRAILEALETKHARRSAIDVDISLAWDRLEADGVFCWL